MSRHHSPEIQKKLVRDEHGKLVEAVEGRGTAAAAMHTLNNSSHDTTTKVADATDTAREAVNNLNKLASDFGDAYAEFNAVMKRAVNETRDLRMALGNEIKPILNDLGDIRKFLFDQKHESEMKTLRELVELCERIEYVNQKGVLSAVAELILKLAEK
jgi:hypothetical protein